MNKSPVQTFYSRRPRKSGSDVTVVYQIDYAKKQVAFGLASCHKHDTFVKKDGRGTAMSRFNTDPIRLDMSAFKSDRYRDVINGLRDILDLEVKKA